MSFEVEQRFAAREMGYTYTEYLALPGAMRWAEDSDCKAAVIVMYRLGGKLKLIENGAV